LALILGKPAGVIGAAWAVMRMNWCRLPAEVSWSGVVLVGLLAGIGFNMDMFIAMLAYSDPLLLDAAKLGVLRDQPPRRFLWRIAPRINRKASRRTT
jgi:Na+:H+ antiporter, NhaA family